MAELTVPSKKRRALAELLMSQQGPQPQMVGNQMAYDPNAGLLSGLAKGIGGYLQGREMKATDDQAKSRREVLATLLGGSPVSGGAPSVPGEASPSSPSAARPASSDAFKQAALAFILKGDDEGATQTLNYGKSFADDPAKRYAPDNYVLPETGKVVGGQYDEKGTFFKLPNPVFKPQTGTFDPYQDRVVYTGGLPLDMVDGYQPPAAAQPQGTPPQGAATPPAALPAAPTPGARSFALGGKSPQARRLEQDEAYRQEQAATNPDMAWTAEWVDGTCTLHGEPQ